MKLELEGHGSYPGLCVSPWGGGGGHEGVDDVM